MAKAIAIFHGVALVLAVTLSVSVAVMAYKVVDRWATLHNLEAASSAAQDD